MRSWLEEEHVSDASIATRNETENTKRDDVDRRTRRVVGARGCFCADGVWRRRRLAGVGTRWYESVSPGNRAVGVIPEDRLTPQSA